MNDFIEKPASQNRPRGEAASTESLQAMSPVELADALEQLLDSMTEESYDPALIDAYLDALDQKVPMPEEPDTQAAFQAFQRRIQNVPFSHETTPIPNDRTAEPGRKRSLKRVVSTVAATAALLLALMVGAQAAGFNVFGNLARWTDELFFFIPSSNENPHNAEYHDMFQQALEEQGLPGELAPAWYPKGFIAGEPEFWDNDMSSRMEVTYKNTEEKDLRISVEKYHGLVSLASTPYEKDGSPVESYFSNQKTFYIMSNKNITLAVWSNENLLESIRGEISVDQVKRIIDSIGG